jgi:hypothetical protein
VKGLRSAAPLRPALRLLALSFFLFGVSDVIERYTGAWWRPAWLLALKAGCVLGFIVGFACYYRIRRRLGDPSAPRVDAFGDEP